MDVFGSRLRRRIWQPLLVILAAAAAAPLVIFLRTPAPKLLWLYELVLVLLVVTAGILLTRMVVSPVLKLANLAEELAPGLLGRTSTRGGEISAVAETVSSITSQMREKD